MLDKSSWRSLCVIAPLFNTWPRFCRARMTSFLLILVRCYLKTLKCAGELLFPLAFFPPFLSFFLSFLHRFCKSFQMIMSAPPRRLLFLFSFFWLVKSVRMFDCGCHTGCGHFDLADARQETLGSSPQRPVMIGVHAGWGGEVVVVGVAG